MNDRPVDVLTKPTTSDEWRAFFRERGWTIQMDDRPGQAFDPFVHVAEAAARSATPSSEEDGPTGNRVWGDCRRCGTPFANCPAEPDLCCPGCWHVAEVTPDGAGRSPIDVDGGEQPR